MQRGACGWLLGVIVLLSACVATPRRSETVLDPAAQQAAIAALDKYQLQGRVAVAAGTEGFNASMDWNQSGTASSVRLAGPMGAGALQMQFGDGHLRIESRGQNLLDAAAQELMQQQLGFAPPLDALRYWLLGLPAPQGQSQETRSPDGQLLSLTQQGWRVEYQEYQPQQLAVGRVSLPTKLRATRDDLRLRVVIDSWRLSTKD
ncbi:MAG: lipoprotein insertase outer membrane protein LolB [Pseudomonadota bacterium]